MNRSRELAEVLMHKARGDASMLGVLMKNPRMPDWGVGFHAQQAVEKALKAVLGALGVNYTYTHNIGLLLQMLLESGHSVPPDGEDLSELTPFGALERYGGQSEEPEPPPSIDRSWALGAVRRTLEWAQESLDRLDARP